MATILLPGLNPIESVWNFVKDYMQHDYPELGQGRQWSWETIANIVRGTRDLGFDKNDLENMRELMTQKIKSNYNADWGDTLTTA